MARNGFDVGLNENNLTNF